MPKNQKELQVNPTSTDSKQSEEEHFPVDKTVFAKVSATYSGPLPPPSFFEQYEQTLPGSADRILTMAENEQINRNNWESIHQQSNIDREDLGQWLGLFVAISCIGGTIFLGFYGHYWPAIFLAGASAASLVGRFTGRRNDRRRE